MPLPQRSLREGHIYKVFCMEVSVMKNAKNKHANYDCSKGYRLIEDLQSNPERFHKNKQSLGLLEELFHGFPVIELRPLLHSNNTIIKREAIWIVSELVNAEDLIDDALPLLNDDDDFVVFYAAEIVARFYRNINDFSRIFKLLEHPNQNVVYSAMNLISRFSKSELQWAYDFFQRMEEYDHAQGIWALLHCDEIDKREILKLINGSNLILSKYGQICVDT